MWLPKYHSEQALWPSGTKLGLQSESLGSETPTLFLTSCAMLEKMPHFSEYNFLNGKIEIILTA